MPEQSPQPLKIGVSACLLGDRVRFDAGHKRDAFIADVLAPFVTYVKVCPELEVGMGAPRESLRLVEEEDGKIHLRTTKSQIDHTEAMHRYAQKRVAELGRADLSGYILKRASPSCGMERVKVYRLGMPTKSGSGVFAHVLMQAMPHLPVEEEGRLCDATLRENFVERIFAYRRLTLFFRSPWRVGQLVAFHTAEKLLLMAHSPAAYSALGRLVASAKDTPRAQLVDEYTGVFMGALKKIATVKKHCNVLQHAAGHLKKMLSAADKSELGEVIEDYHQGLIPLVVPITLIKHHVRVHSISYLAQQSYFQPHPKELMLRNHV